MSSRAAFGEVKNGWKVLDDLLRAYINFETVEEVLQAYEMLKNNERVEVVFVLPRFGTRSDGSLNLNDLTVLFIYFVADASICVTTSYEQWARETILIFLTHML